MDHFDSNRGNDPPRSDLPPRPVTPRGLPPPDAQTAQYQERAHQAGFGKEVQGNIVRRSPDFTDCRERRIKPDLEGGTGELAGADAAERGTEKYA